jgi:hypothetical protein
MRLSRSALYWIWNLVASNPQTKALLNCLSLIRFLRPRKAGTMSYQAIKEYLMAVVERYQKADKSGKSKMLTEAVAVTKLSRKHLIRVLKQPKEAIAKKKASGRKKKYDPEILNPHIQFLWIQMERISARRMKVALSDWLPFYKDPAFTTQVRLWLDQMSAATLERRLRVIRGSLEATHGLTTTPTGGSPSRYMKNKIPLNTFDQKIDRPGFMQSDTVAHCGTSTEGQYVNSITLTDIFSAWTENRTIFSKKAQEVRKRFHELKQALPFDLLAVNVDNGTEFLNTPVFNFMNPTDEQKKIIFTRSRPYKKNDNCYVEQKNFTHVRELFGYERFDDEALVELMNEIYRDYWNPLQNFFIPTFKLESKTRIGARIVKKFDKPKTPYDRLLLSEHLSDEQKQNLKNLKKSLNPFHLKTEMEAKLKIFFELHRKSKTREAS